MAAGGGYFECTFHVFLSFDFGKVEIETALPGVEFFAGVDNGGFQFALAVEKLDDFLDVVYAVHPDVVHHGCFTGILPGYNHAFKTQFACLDGNGQYPFDGLQATVEA